MISRFRSLLSATALLLLAAPTPAHAELEGRSSCIRCHSGLQETLARPIEQWRTSVHAENGISCEGCHGGDPFEETMTAMAPEKGFTGVPKQKEIPNFCGKCHPGVKENYIDSRHGEMLGSGGPHCVTCHGSHVVERASLELISPEHCARCHGYERAAEIRGALAETDEGITGLERKLRRLHRVGVAVKDLNGKLFDARNTFHRLFHTVDVQKVRNRTEEIQSRLKDIRQEVTKIETRLGRRKKAGAVVVGLLLITAVLFFYLRYTYKVQETRDIK